MSVEDKLKSAGADLARLVQIGETQNSVGPNAVLAEDRCLVFGMRGLDREIKRLKAADTVSLKDPGAFDALAQDHSFRRAVRIARQLFLRAVAKAAQGDLTSVARCLHLRLDVAVEPGFGNLAALNMELQALGRELFGAENPIAISVSGVTALPRGALMNMDAEFLRASAL